MDVVLYKAKQRDGGYIYDMSLNPKVDFVILKGTRKIRSLTVITPKIPIEIGENILKRVYGASNIVGKIIGSQDFLINNALKKFNVPQIKKEIVSKEVVDKNSISIVEQYIKGKIISIRQLINLKSYINSDEEEIIDAVQVLYCERRIKMIPSVRKVRNRMICSFCNKEPCSICRFGFLEDDILLYAADNYNLKSVKKVILKKPILTVSLKKAYDDFSLFIKSKKEWAVLWCVPGSFDYEAIVGGIAETIKYGGRILIVTSSFENLKAAEALRKTLKDINISCTADNGWSLKDEDIVIHSIKNYSPFYKAFDLVIFDKRYAFLEEKFEDAELLYKKAVKENGKFAIITSFIPKNKPFFIKGGFEIIPLTSLKTKNPIPEPRIVLTRLINGGDFYLPSMVVDIINWSIKEETGIIIFVPDEKIQDKVYNYLTLFENFNPSLLDISSERYKQSVLKLKRNEIRILISSDFKDLMNFNQDINVIVVCSDDKRYDVETLINMASIASSSKNKKIGEVVFVASNETETMSLAKSTIRSMNKISWERGYIRR
ncbi:hypothetical protein FDN13_09550 [Caloramator sp. E03]|uniref:hypothetical protein n=1 Tax=Caloramator sp. E03 TaxID=2576307 RepID=UPI001110226D|nr:hypothetical protein [Caloramator sp. E03]QCX33926.1 hypothetical protein FDN13_09550 [Caloramator sp. E03]